MSPFGLFDLLKTLLPTPEQTPETPQENAPNNKTQTTNTQPPPEEFSSSVPSSSPPKNNACADFLYRHEQRVKNIKDVKKRLD